MLTINFIKYCRTRAKNTGGIRFTNLVWIDDALGFELGGTKTNTHGEAPEQADAFIAQCRDEFDLPVKGLMCIPPVGDEPSLHFALLREIAKRHDLSWLSMGMSADYEVAVAFGATHVRVGTGIFGQRPGR